MRGEPVTLAAIAYLVRHCAEANECLPPPAVAYGSSQAVFPRRPVGQRAEWMLELFERQAALRRMPPSARASYSAGEA